RQRAGRVGLRVEVVERVDARAHPRRLVDAEDRSAGARNVERAVGQRGVEDRLPEIIAVAGGLPVAGELPSDVQVVAAPRVLRLSPRLGRVVGDVERARLEHHVDGVAVDERRLEVGEEVFFTEELFGLGHLLRDEGTLTVLELYGL